MPILMEFIGDSMADKFRNRSVKIKNIKLTIGDRIYRDIFRQVGQGPFHSFSSDGVEDIKIRHSINLFLQSETVNNPGECYNYFARMVYYIYT